MLVLHPLNIFKLKTSDLMIGIYCMQLRKLANRRFILVLGELFLSIKSKVNNQADLSLEPNVFKISRFDLPKYLLVLLMLGLQSQPLFAEENVSEIMSSASGSESDDTQKKPKEEASDSASITHEPTGLANEITAIITAKQNPYLMRSDFRNRAEDLDALYKLAGYKLLWLADFQADKNRADVLKLLEDAAFNGLDSADYDSQALKNRLPAESVIASNDYKQLALYDTAISLSLLRFLHDLHYGRINPKGINFNLKLREKKLIDLPTVINSSLNQANIAQLPDRVEPKLKQYQKLKQALSTYLLASKNSVAHSFVFTKPIKQGEAFPKSQELEKFLVSLGDLPNEGIGSSKEANQYTRKLAFGIKKFQSRHGIEPDGVLGKSTIAELNAPLSERVTRIELAMERLRWLPEMNTGATIIVNIPAFQLWAYDDINDFETNIPNMRVVVGKALKNETPVLMAEMRFIDFMPYWNVPYNIVKKEILPKLMQNPGYLASENMELVSTFGNESKAVAFSAGTISGLNQGTVRVRQRPGKKNALGKVKFIFPNKSDVYLHDTPSRSLFSRSRRDFSHGCVRVQNPEQLAEFVLKNQLSKEAIEEALQTQKTRRVVLKKSIPVLFFYSTSFIDQHGNLAFYPDVYGYDAVLQEELKKSVDLSDQEMIAPPPPPVLALDPFATTNNPEVDKKSDKEP